MAEKFLKTDHDYLRHNGIITLHRGGIICTPLEIASYRLDPFRRRLVMLRYKIITLIMLLAGLTLASNFRVSAQQVSEGQRLAMYSKPAVVRILDGYIGKVFWPKNGKTYNVQYVGSGSGSFISSNGYIATNAHVTDLTHQGEEKGKEYLFRDFIRQLAQDYGENPNAIFNNASLLQAIGQQSSLQSIDHIHHVILPNGKAYMFEIKAFGAPVLKLGDSDKVQLQDHITVLGYPAAADTSVLSKESALEASITDGKVSAKKSSSEGAPILQVSAPSTHGNSG